VPTLPLASMFALGITPSERAPCKGGNLQAEGHIIMKNLNMSALLCGLAFMAMSTGASGGTKEYVCNCDGISGHSYYLPALGKKGECVRDRAKGAAFKLIINEKTDSAGNKSTSIDLLYRDAASNGYRNPKQEGGKIVWYLSYSPGEVIKEVTLEVTNWKRDLYEIYTFNMKTREMYLSQHRIGGMIPKVSIFKSKCD
jgi:hypothetical protein